MLDNNKPPKHQVFSGPNNINFHLTNILNESLATELEWLASQMKDERDIAFIENRLKTFRKTEDKKPVQVTKAGSNEPLCKIFDDVVPFKLQLLAQRPEAIIVCVVPNTMGDIRTCMYFPFQHGDKCLPNSSMTPEMLYDAMLSVGESTWYRALDIPKLQKSHTKGWSNCRLCDCNNGSVELRYGKYRIPEGIVHYMSVHGLPANLFSFPFNQYRIYYIAKRPFNPKKAVVA